MRMQLIAGAAIAGLVMAVPLTASAEWYAGVGAGNSENKTPSWKIGGPGFSGDSDNRDSAGKLFLGYRLWDEYVAVEVAYVNLGDMKVEGTSGGDPSTGVQTMRAYTIGLVGGIPIYKSLSANIHLGFSRNSSDIKTTIGGSTTTSSAEDFEFYWGAGLRLDVAKNFAVRAALERFEVDNHSVNLVTGSVLFSF